MKQHETITATFTPWRRDDLKPGVEEWIGWRGQWRVVWMIEEGDYVDQWALMPLGERFPWIWSPLCDLSEVHDGPD